MTKDEDRVTELSYWQWAIVGAIDVIGPVASDAYTPNTTQMRKDLETTNIMTGLTLQLNWLSKGLATLWIGGLSDLATVGRLGAFRRTFVVFIGGAVGSYFTPGTTWGIYALIVFRVVEGLGESATTICSAIARDVVEEPDERMKVLTVISSARLFAIAVAPTLGGIIGDAYGWRFLFAVLAGIAFVLAICTFTSLPETLKIARQRRRQKKTSDLTQRLLEEEDVKEDDEHNDVGFGAVLKQMCFDGSPECGKARASICFVVFSVSALMCFLSDVSPILEQTFGVSVLTTSLLMGSNSMVYVATNIALAYAFAAYKGSRWLQPEALLKLALQICAVSSAGHFLCAFGPAVLRNNWLYMLLNSYIFGVALSLGYGAASTLFIQPYPHAAGKAAAVMLIARTVMSSGLSQVSIDIVDAFGMTGYNAYFATVSALAQVAWLFLPRENKVTAVAVPTTDIDTQSGEQLRQQPRPPPADSTVSSSSDVGSQIDDEP